MLIQDEFVCFSDKTKDHFTSVNFKFTVSIFNYT